MNHHDDEKSTDFMRIDFSQEGDKENIRKCAINNAQESTTNHFSPIHLKERYFMKRYMKYAAITAMAVVCVVGFSMTTYGKDLYQIIKSAFVGEHAQYIVTEEPDGEIDRTLPEELAGLLFDKDGNELTEFLATDGIYNADGERITISVQENGTYVISTDADAKAEREARFTKVATAKEAAAYLSFEPVMPTWLPAGYDTLSIYLFNDEDGKPSENSDYLSVYIEGALQDDIYMQLRNMNEDTAFTAGFGDFKEITINGYDGLLFEGSSLEIEMDGVLYSVMAGRNDAVTDNDLIKIFESISNQ